MDIYTTTAALTLAGYLAIPTAIRTYALLATTLILVHRYQRSRKCWTLCAPPKHTGQLVRCPLWRHS